ncbi:phage baseplate assembly protein V [Candidatus Nitronereus thalassa]|uniref:Phage baseplate assembly protein V n=1 Tax=Candidatus Nitronereus thalassa TaxID=3020898 RepID=A0ABU3K4Y1_9BACT|nr:phage baseplate assembly protein V [Candidatus Nitronereus thalassa]MDT7041462.1 phage baseplate assembly protein V [Candidatus Nitronereus thalassa]
MYPALVNDVKDPDQLGRVQVELPWAPAAEVSGSTLPGVGKAPPLQVWARLACPMAGAGRGTWWIPDVGDEVLVAFEGGNPGAPYVVGALWNGQDQPPESMDGEGNNDLKTLKTRSGVRLRINDKEGQESMELRTPAGQRIEIKDGSGGQVHIMDTNGNVIKLTSSGIEISSSAKVKINASTLDVSAATVKLKAALVDCDGIVKCETMQAKSVIASSYTPGAGNVW